MSTDTAFVLGVLALFGPRCPDRLRLFLLTLAIVDDIGAISVMALFYSGELDLTALAVAGLLTAVLLGLRWAGVWRLTPYVLVGVALWGAVHASGVHATVAGVLLAWVAVNRPRAWGVLTRYAGLFAGGALLRYALILNSRRSSTTIAVQPGPSHATVTFSTSFCSSPAWYMSIMMSEPPMKVPST